MTVFLMLESYRLERLLIWRNPEQFAKGYQTVQGLYAIGSGKDCSAEGLAEESRNLGLFRRRRMT